MGRKRIRTRQYIYFCTTCLIISSLFSCAVFQNADHIDEAGEAFSRGNNLLLQKKYDGALFEFQKVLSLPSRNTLKENTLFHMGLIYAHTDNPHRDVEKSLDTFKRLIKQYPDSPLTEQTKVWVGILEENEKLSQTIQKLKQVDLEIEEMRRKKTPP